METKDEFRRRLSSGEGIGLWNQTPETAAILEAAVYLGDLIAELTAAIRHPEED